MIETKRGQDIEFMCWTPVDGHGWFTECVPLSREHELLEVFEWPLREMEEPFADDDETRAWAKLVRRARVQRAKEDPF